MGQSFIYSVHEWLADHVRWVQYPNVSTPRRPIFNTAMPWTTRVMLVLIGLIAVIVSAVALLFLGLLAWATITA